ncbi:uncharacterized protein F5147DRAFT_774850 [Suillus discolor]|uniref:ATPase dynein-related AAA domain-containing protein n=1 Tax=Suillus discolor TaxID=1912936 RepID=A0A9P7F5L5_9AGAM|nr:uncharacterized protein F5147DRAFT_774850 [Suillus discolor]KAG2106569.1 hypothetical protein F5147DRAFT_774850 [Suillus discolor]
MASSSLTSSSSSWLPPASLVVSDQEPHDDGMSLVSSCVLRKYFGFFEPLLIDLCARWLHDDDDIEDRFIAFRLLIELHEKLHPSLYAFLQTPCLSKGPLAFIAAAPSVAEIETICRHRMLLAYYRLLRANLPKHLLSDGSLLSKLFFPPHPDTGVRLLAARYYASHIGMAEIECERLITHVLGKFCGVDCPINYAQTIDGTVIETDSWLVSTLEIKRIHDARDTVLESSDFYSLDAEGVLQPLWEADLSSLLVHALRHGHWIVLDELNFAPTDVLEALNRLLDDNRELIIPETQENPPGLYAGSKVLSRAFRRCFLEVHFQDVPQAELETILCQRCRIALSYGQKIISVFRELQQRRRFCNSS